MQVEETEKPFVDNFRAIYKPISIDNESILEKIGSMPIIFKNYAILLNDESPDTFHTFDMDSHEIKEGKFEGSIPNEIAENGACFYEEGMIILLGRITEKAEKYKDLFLLEISEDPEELGKLRIESKIWYEGQDSSEGFLEVSGIYKYQSDLYVLGLYGETRGLWTFNQGKFIILISK